MDRPIEKEGIAFTAALVGVEDILKNGAKAMREFQRANMTLTAIGRAKYRPLRFDGQTFSVEYEEMPLDNNWCVYCNAVVHSHSSRHHESGMKNA